MPSTPAAQPKTKPKAPKKSKIKNLNTAGKLAMAESQGLLAGARTQVIRGRMPAALVAEAKRNSGITSDSKLIEAALATLVVEDTYWQWMMEHEGTIPKELDLDICL
jgi:hypothetical protein